MKPVRCGTYAAVALLAVATSHVNAQGQEATQDPPPATKLEGFQPAAGTLVTFGYDELGKVNDITVDVRELRDTRGSIVRGLVVDVTQSEYRQERAFVDADEIPELLRGIDALLAVSANPTRFKNFEVRYTTRGELKLTAFNNKRGNIRFSVQAGRVTTASEFLDREAFLKLRELFAAAQETIGGLDS